MIITTKKAQEVDHVRDLLLPLPVRVTRIRKARKIRKGKIVKVEEALEIPLVEIEDTMANKRVAFATLGRTLVSAPRTTKENADMTILKINVVHRLAPIVLVKEEVPEVQVKGKAKEKEKERKGNAISHQR
jgi:hypothetical protein